MANALNGANLAKREPSLAGPQQRRCQGRRGSRGLLLTRSAPRLVLLGEHQVRLTACF